MTQKNLFRIWVIWIYLEFGAWDLVLPYSYALCLSLAFPEHSDHFSKDLDFS